MRDEHQFAHILKGTGHSALHIRPLEVAVDSVSGHGTDRGLERASPKAPTPRTPGRSCTALAGIPAIQAINCRYDERDARAWGRTGLWESVQVSGAGASPRKAISDRFNCTGTSARRHPSRSPRPALGIILISSTMRLAWPIRPIGIGLLDPILISGASTGLVVNGQWNANRREARASRACRQGLWAVAIESLVHSARVQLRAHAGEGCCGPPLRAPDVRRWAWLLTLEANSARSAAVG